MQVEEGPPALPVPSLPISSTSTSSSRALSPHQVLDDSAVADAGIDGGEGEGGGEGEDEGQDVGGFYFGTMLKRRPELQEKIKLLKDEVRPALCAIPHVAIPIAHSSSH